ncbi:Glucosyl transferase [Hyella patelloides LEGE 07179]|uniref:Glucosyl transferase n=1 Tax=Hyella patelloides LEGE 07179 TaxID=945734 RepID=A0A563VXB7_9CYAN|nr:glycosyltransferase [Hyella patelloides]VEP16066.1 Glucosyl transferase [Hyella patelloides LEGE 07179]
MNQNLLVSIIINNYNYGSFIAEAIDSALNQTYSPIEVIVVDDGSTDNSREIIASYGDKIIPVLKKNGGQASAYNAGVAATSGEIICFLDSDDFFLPEKVALVVKVFQANSEIGWCFNTVKLIDDKTNQELGLTRQSGVGKCDFRDSVINGTSLYVPPSSGLCFRRSLLAQILPIPEVFINGADGYPMKAAPVLSPGFMFEQALTIMRVHGDNNSTYRQDRPQLQTKNILTAYFLRAKFPQLAKVCNRMFAKGLSAYWKYKVIYVRYGVPYQGHRKSIADYFTLLSLLEKIEIILRAIYYSFPQKATNSINLALK